jgi:hypothetical protein
MVNNKDPDVTHAQQKDPLPAPQQGLTFDEALTHYIGEFGKGQLRIVSGLDGLASAQMPGQHCLQRNCIGCSRNFTAQQCH